MHYRRWYTKGDVLWKPPTTEERFWARVEKTESCWLWMGTLSPDGYGRFRSTDEPRTNIAHIYSYELHNGPVPCDDRNTRMPLDHICHSPACELNNLCPHRRCVRPDHLRIATARENLLNSSNFMAAKMTATHCKYGHPLFGPNLRIEPSSGRRKCRACASRKFRDWYQRSKRRKAGSENDNST